MKDLITAIGSILILMMFLMQFAANQITYTRIMGAEHSIKEFRLLSEERGSISNDDISELKGKLSEVLRCQTSEISVEVAESGGDYSVTMPIYGVIGPAGIMGLSEKENMRLHKSSGIIIFKEQEEDEVETPEKEKEEKEKQEDSL